MEELTKGKERTLKRDTSLLQEFDDSNDPNLLVLYHHLRDGMFDCFNAREYHQQMLDYYSNNIKVVEVVNRRIRENDYFLVCLRNSDNPGANPALCEMAFQAQRQFAGYTMLVKKQCFVCNSQTGVAKKCSACQCACFCSKACLQKGWSQHKKLCKMVGASLPSISLDKEVLQIDMK
jgi:hypothetical protein